MKYTTYLFDFDYTLADSSRGIVICFRNVLERIKTIATRDLTKSVKTGGCGECQTSCQSACKTSCGVANQQCENSNK